MGGRDVEEKDKKHRNIFCDIRNRNCYGIFIRWRI